MQPHEGHETELVEFTKGALEPAIRIERTTCGLRNSASPAMDSLPPQETTHQDAPEMEADGASLSRPGSSVVAEYEPMDAWS